MAITYQENHQYIQKILIFFESYIGNQEKKHVWNEQEYTRKWKSLLQEQNNYLYDIKQSLSMDDFSYFCMLLAFVMEVSPSTQNQVKEKFHIEKVTLQLAIFLFQKVDEVYVRNITTPCANPIWTLLYSSSDSKEMYVHDFVLLLYPWVIHYIIDGSMMENVYGYYLVREKISVYKDETKNRFLQYLSTGVKSIVTKEDEEELLQLLSDMEVPVYSLTLSLLPQEWTAQMMHCFCLFFYWVTKTVIFINYDDESQKPFFYPALKYAPFTILISDENLLINEIKIIQKPFLKEMYQENKQIPFVKVISHTEQLPEFIAEESFQERLQEVEYMAKHKDEIYHLMEKEEKGLAMLFYGPSGCGKTLGAQMIAAKLHKDIWQIDISNVMDKYIGESEKHLEIIFQKAQRENVVLLFDEADVLFSKRTNVSSSHDRYANALTSYLLQRMESYAGVMILTSNLLHNFDDAFLRRMMVIIRFKEATQLQRLKKWQTALSRIPLHSDIEWESISKIALSYARIDQCVFTALSFMNLNQHQCLYEEDIKKAIVYELEKHGEQTPLEWVRNANELKG